MKQRLFWLALILIIVNSCSNTSNEISDPKIQFATYCGGCHLTPDLKSIPQSIWEKNILPEMAARLGYTYNGYNPLAYNSMEENHFVKLSGIYPKRSTIDSLTWKQIHEYVISHAPKEIAIDSLRDLRNSELKQFEARPVSLNSGHISLVTFLQYQELENEFVIGDARGKLFSWPQSRNDFPRLNSPVTSYYHNGNDLVLTEAGRLHPSEKPMGIISNFHSSSIDTIAHKLHRPVFTKVIDLDDDGSDEILVCEFGNHTGALSLIVKSQTGYTKKKILPVPGTIKVEVTDMNNDGKKDIIVLAAQAKEGVYILYQDNNLQFKQEQVLKFTPEFGVSWFELVDYNNDNYLDLVVLNGDNADYSDFPKANHGVRIFINDGFNKFKEEWFYPIHGSTKVLAADYDLDGDVDFAVSSYFPEYDCASEEGFVYLENKDAQSYKFQSYTFKEAVHGRWLVMEQGDYDKDGDLDILLGSSLILPLKKKFDALSKKMKQENVNIMVLNNQTID